jgi:hypothetical protein
MSDATVVERRHILKEPVRMTVVIPRQTTAVAAMELVAHVL